MKLVLCEKCWDVFKLSKEMRQCGCGDVKGRYLDNFEAEVSANAVSIAIGNGSLSDAIQDMRDHNSASKGEASRESYFEAGCGKISHAWVRPNTGEGNPHCSIIEDD